MAVVDKTDRSTPVPPGTVGQVRLTVLHDGLLLPDILERDQALCHRTDRWPGNGVAKVRPLRTTSPAPEGLY